MKKHIKHIRWLRYSCLLLLLLSSACGSTKPVRTSSMWDEFGQSVVDAGKHKNVTYLARELSLSNPTIGKWVVDRIREEPNIEVVTPKQELQESEIIAYYMEDAWVFLRSYEDLLKGKMVRVTTSQPEPRVGSLEARAVVIWVEKDGRYHGIYISTADQTPWGIKVSTWTGHTGYGQVLPWKQTVNLVRDNLEDCVYPEDIDFTYQWEPPVP